MTGTTLTSISPESFRRTPWKNGGGVTIDIADAYRTGAAPGGWQGMIWRFGRTGIVSAGPFSDFTGFERLQTVIAGSGLVLETPEGEIDLRRPLTVARYDGGLAVMSRLEGGPVEVVNLIADRSLCTIELHVLNAGDGAALLPGHHVAYAPEGEAAGLCGNEPVTLAGNHALQIDIGSPSGFSVSAGTVLLASIMPR